MRGFMSMTEWNVDSKTVDGLGRSVQRLGDLILAMRKDVGLSNRGIVTGSTHKISKGTIMGARYMLRYPDLFLNCLRENPDTPLSQLAEVEKKLNREML